MFNRVAKSLPSVSVPATSTTAVVAQVRSFSRHTNSQLRMMDGSQHKPLPYTGPSKEDVRKMRAEHLVPSLFLYYRNPIMVVEGKGQFVWDETGRRYLDCFGGIVTIRFVFQPLCQSSRRSVLLHHFLYFCYITIIYILIFEPYLFFFICALDLL